MIAKRYGGVTPPGNDGCQQRAKIPLKIGIGGNLLAFALPTGPQERDQISFKTIPPVIGIESRDNRRQPPDCGNKQTDGCGLHEPVEKTGNQSRLLEPPAGSPREQTFHARKRGGEFRPFADLVDPGPEAEEPENGVIELIGPACRGIPCRALQGVLDHHAPDLREALGGLRGSDTDRKPLPEKAFDPLVGWRTAIKDGLP